MKKVQKRMFVLILLLICCFIGIKTYKTYMGTEVEEIKKKEKHNNYLTFYVQQDNGSYAEQSGNTFPTGTYQINTSMTKCEDQFGEKVTPSFSMNNGSVTVTSTRTVYCTLYMDKANYTATFSFASETAPLSGTTWNASWTLPNATQYCITQSSNPSGCSWQSLSSSVTSYSSSYTFTTTGQQTYYFYVRNASGIMASASDIITIINSAPTCTFTADSRGGVTFTKSDNADRWYVGTKDIADQNVDSNYDNPTTLTFPPSTLYGYVKNSSGIGKCKADMYAEAPGCSQVSQGSAANCSWNISTCTKQGDKYVEVHSLGSGSSCPKETIYGGCQDYSVGAQAIYGCTCGGGSGATYQCSLDQKEYSSQDDCTNNCKASSCKDGYTASNPGGYPLYCYKMS